MKRRSFFSLIAAAPLVPAAAQDRPAGPPQASAAPTLIEATTADAACQPAPSFFTPAQFATLTRLCDLLMPAGDNPGAIDAGAPEFLDFLIGASPVPAQRIYREGLDALEQRARTRTGKSFAALAPAEADPLLGPLHEPWTYDPPRDPLARFLGEAKQAVRQATMNSRPYVLQASKRRRSASGIGQYWYPLD
jgi:hypothetical protein